MRIALVSEHASPLATLGGVDAGGQNVHVGALADALGARGHRVVVHTRADAPGLPPRVRTGPNVEVEHVAAGPPEAVGKDDLLPWMDAFADGLARSWRADRPDVVHGHFWMSGMTAVAATAGTDIPVVQTFHALGTVKRRWQGADDTSPSQRLDIERALARCVDRIVATCTDEVRELAAMGAPPDRIDVVPCGVDASLFRPADDPVAAPARATSRTSGGPARLLMLGRLVPRKGVEDAIRALAAIPDAELVVVGGPPAADLDDDPEVERLRGIATRYGVSDRLVLTGHRARADLPGLIRSCDVVLAVPRYEPFGIVPLEAMACGVPVVASAVGGLLDTVVDGQTGVFVPPGDPAAIAAAARDLLANDGRRAAMGRAGAERTRHRYSWARVAAMTETTYRSVLAARSRSHAGAAS